MNEAEFLKQFESLGLPPEDFKHKDHLRLAWYLSGHCKLTEAIDRLVKGIKRFAIHAGAPDLYHETITLFYLYEIYARRLQMEEDHSWEDFRRSNPDLFASHLDFMNQHYQQDVLSSAVAKVHYIPPNLESTAHAPDP